MRVPTWSGMARRMGQGLGYGVVPRARRGGQHFAKATCAWLDLDLYKLPTSSDVVEQITTCLPPPSAVVNSGAGVHLLWRLDAPREPGDVEMLNQELASALPWPVDPVWQRSRVLRLPGSLNLKGSSPRWCRLRYLDPSRVLRWSPGHLAPARAPAHSGTNSASDLGEASLPPQARAAIEASDWLQRLWGGEGLELGTPSPSEYDWQIARHLLRRGLTEDEVAATVAVRRRGQKPVDYARRTAAKAAASLSLPGPRSGPAPRPAKRGGAVCPSGESEGVE